MARPPAWAHIEIGEKAAGQIAGLGHSIAATVEAANREVAQKFIVDQLRTAVDQATESGGQDLFFPTEPVEGFIIPLSILVALPALPVGAEEQPRMHALTAFAAKASNPEITSLGGQPAIRSMKDATAVVDDQDNLLVPATRQVSYVLWAPGAGNRLVAFVGSMVRLDSEEGPALTEALEFLFDTMMDTVRFSSEEAPGA
jgi:hypothetical protein